jgi:D-tagatose-1,6-bisphosphate aldolase subunit GatZ/KbaZ
MSHPLDEIIHAQKRGEARGILSICSAHPWVLKTALRSSSPVLIESTCNQVNQFGGYTGMQPGDFVRFVHNHASENNFPLECLLLGGDHLGPSPWQDQPAEIAMHHATDMVQAYVQAGFSKIHLDTSMKLGDDDPIHPVDLELAARRTAQLAKAAEAVSSLHNPLRFVIGSEVPIPGGAIVHEDRICVTTVEDARYTLEVTKAAFADAGLEQVWERVIAMVVQPGVEFGNDFILDYSPSEARDLALFCETTPFIFEAHSTDYQTKESLRSLVKDHFAILKAGPSLTFAFRKTVFALAMIENELFPLEECSRLIETLDEAMLRSPSFWEKYYPGNEQNKAFARKFSLSDRIRYYWPDPEVQAAIKKLLFNLRGNIPLSIISQYLPDVYPRIRSGQVLPTTSEILNTRIQDVLDLYS